MNLPKVKSSDHKGICGNRKEYLDITIDFICTYVLTHSYTLC